MPGVRQRGFSQAGGSPSLPLASCLPLGFTSLGLCFCKIEITAVMKTAHRLDLTYMKWLSVLSIKVSVFPYFTRSQWRQWWPRLCLKESKFSKGLWMPTSPSGMLFGTLVSTVALPIGFLSLQPL